MGTKVKCETCRTTYEQDELLFNVDKLEYKCPNCKENGKLVEVRNKTNTFIKHDQDKPNLAILFDTPKALGEVAKVESYGAKKYDRKNWDKVEDRERYIAANLRHLASYQSGEKIDHESGLSHLAHAITSLLFVLELEMRDEA